MPSASLYDDPAVPTTRHGPSNNAVHALYRAALGPVHQERYLALFDRFDEAGRTRAGWNTAASLTTLNWMLLYQLWGAALVYVALVEGLAFLILGIGRNVLQWPAPVEWGVMAALALFAFALPGLFGDALLHTEVRKRMTRALTAAHNIPQACNLLARQASSWTRLAWIAAANLLLFAALGAAWILLPGPGEETSPRAQAILGMVRGNGGLVQRADPATDPASASAPTEPASAPAPAEPASASASTAPTPAPPDARTTQAHDETSDAVERPQAGAATTLPAASEPAPAPTAPAPTPPSAAPPAKAPTAPTSAAKAPEHTAPHTPDRSAKTSAAAEKPSRAASKAAAKPAPAKAPAAPASRSTAPAVSAAPAAPAPVASAASVPEQPPAAPAPEPAASDTPAAVPAPTPAADTNTNTSAPSTLGQAPGYYLNVGLFAEEANARRTQAKLLNAGLPAFRQTFGTSKGERTRVRVGPFSTQAQAQKAAAQIRGMQLDAVMYRQGG